MFDVSQSSFSLLHSAFSASTLPEGVGHWLSMVPFSENYFQPYNQLEMSYLNKNHRFFAVFGGMAG
jgi:hypothetical protein